jgi:hypothetical protein
MKDDPREVGWAEKKIRSLEYRLTHGEDDMTEPLEVWTDRQLSKLAAGVTEASGAIDVVSEELAGTDKAVNHLNERISKLAHELREMQYRVEGLDKAPRKSDSITVLERITALEERVSALEGYPRRDSFGGVVAELPKEMSFEPPIAPARTENIRVTFDEPDMVTRFIEAGPFKAGDMPPRWLMQAKSMNVLRDALIDYRATQ